MIQIKQTDTLFKDSPDASDPDCLCSRCGQWIHEKDAPIIRVFVNRGKDGEYRYCRPCSQAMGIDFGGDMDMGFDPENDE